MLWMRSPIETDLYRCQRHCGVCAIAAHRSAGDCHSSPMSLAIEPRHGPDRASGAALDLQREAYEAEAALAHQLVQVDEPLHVRDAVIAANVVYLEIVAAGAARAGGLHA